MFFLSEFDKNLENATSHLKLDPDWETILLIADGIRQNDVTPKHAITAIRKKMNSSNPHTASYALLVLESIVKNCGSPVHDEMCTKESCEWFTQFIETTPHIDVKNKMLELIQVWAFAFRSYDKYQAIRDIVTILKTKGHTFPELKEADAMFTSETAPDWSDGKVCSHCRVPFTFTQRKHHCRHCGKIFCAQCSAKTCTVPKFGFEKEVRVCDVCYTALHTAGGASHGATSAGVVLKRESSGTSTDSDLPAEYLASTLAQQSQQPPRKTEAELKEEEELQLALALSQSEAEAQTNRIGSYRPLGAASAMPAMRNKSPTNDTPRSLSITGHQHSINGSIKTVTSSMPTMAVVSDSSEHGDSEMAKYMNRDYWEQRKVLDSPASPSAPSPMSQTSSVIPLKSGPEDLEITDFSHNMRTQVEIFVNRMKSNSSRGRNIVTDSAVQTLFMTLTSYHSRLLTYIKDMDDKRMSYEQLQDKLAQVKDSRAALDVLRQEHQDKVRLLAEEQERQRQLMMAHKLDIMRKKKQEYLQYQRQMALQRIQEQEREMAMRQEQQKALYQMGGGMVAGMPFGQLSPMAQGSPHHQQQHQQPQMVGMYGQQYGLGPVQPTLMGLPQQQQQQQQPSLTMYGNGLPPQQQQQVQPQRVSMQQPPNLQAGHAMMQIPPQAGQFMVVGQPIPLQQQPQHGLITSQQQQQINSPNMSMNGVAANQLQSQLNQQVQQQDPARFNSVDVIPQADPAQHAVPIVAEPAEAELISFD